MGVYRLFTGQDGESHIEELSAEALEGISLDGAQMNFSVSQREPGAFSDYHPAPRRRWQVGVQGRTIIGLSDGTSHTFGPGGCSAKPFGWPGDTTLVRAAGDNSGQSRKPIPTGAVGDAG